jgi:hypothetical protein
MMMEDLRPSIAKILDVERLNSDHRKVLKIVPHLRLDRRAVVTSLELYPENWLDRSKWCGPHVAQKAEWQFATSRPR